LIATGVYKAKKLNIDKNFPNIIPALDFLIASNKKGLGDTVPLFDNGKLNADGKDIVVIGGGDTAMDCVRTSIRQNAKSVKCLYRRDKENMPGSAREVLNAEEEGVEFLWKSSPKDFIGDDRITEVLCSRMQLSEPDSSGRQIPEIIEGADYRIKADMVITALGFDPEDIPRMFGVDQLKVTKWGTLKTDFKSMMTDIEGVFAAGDIVRGASLVVWGIRDGRDAAESIHSYIQEKNKEQKKVS
jgi:glutamate synthase (NADPH/NADH) small chain